MKTTLRTSRRARCQGTSFLEILISVFLLGIIFVALFSSFTQGVVLLKSNRENLRATEILLEKVETIRLYNWDQVNTTDFIPVTFSEPLDPMVTNTNQVQFEGSFAIDNSTLGEAYDGKIRLITVRLDWNSGGLKHHREIKTFVSEYGMQNYIY